MKTGDFVCGNKFSDKHYGITTSNMILAYVFCPISKDSETITVVPLLFKDGHNVDNIGKTYSVNKDCFTVLTPYAIRKYREIEEVRKRMDNMELNGELMCDIGDYYHVYAYTNYKDYCHMDNSLDNETFKLYLRRNHIAFYKDVDVTRNCHRKKRKKDIVEADYDLDEELEEVPF